MLHTSNQFFMKTYLSFLLLVSFALSGAAQEIRPEGTFWRPEPRNYEVKHAIEVESLVPMFFYGGYHAALGYRFKKFRVRLSVINGGTYNAETVGLGNSSAQYKRFYQTSPGIFLGYNVWKNLEVYTYIESHTFRIQQRSTGVEKDLRSIDFGLATSYQFFIGRYLYVQPGVHLYLRADRSVAFETETYNIPNADLSFVVRVGARLWRWY
jgi:hypothetical protein